MATLARHVLSLLSIVIWLAGPPVISAQELSLQPPQLLETTAPLASAGAPAKFPTLTLRPPAIGMSLSQEQSRQTVQWLADKLIRHIPTEIDGDSHWGDTKKVWAGIRLRRDGLKLSTKRRHRELRHGRWVRYQIQLPESGQRARDGKSYSDIPVTIHSMKPVLNVDGQLHRWSVDAAIETPAKFDIRVERWNLGVQWFSVNITGDMKLQLRCQAHVGVQADYAEVPPAIELAANVQQAELRVPYFEVQRISKLGGDVAEELGDVAEETILKLWLRSENKKLDERLNRAIQKHRDDMRWSMMDWFATWNQ